MQLEEYFNFLALNDILIKYIRVKKVKVLVFY